MAVRTAVILFAFVVVFTALLAAAYTFTLPAIEAAAAEEKMKLIDEVLPRSAYDNDLLKDTLTLGLRLELGLEAASTAYRARRTQTVALVFEAIALTATPARSACSSPRRLTARCTACASSSTRKRRAWATTSDRRRTRTRHGRGSPSSTVCNRRAAKRTTGK